MEWRWHLQQKTTISFHMDLGFKILDFLNNFSTFKTLNLKTFKILFILNYLTIYLLYPFHHEEVGGEKSAESDKKRESEIGKLSQVGRD